MFDNDKGITLVELIISISIMSIIFLVITNFLMFGLKAHKSTSNEVDSQTIVRLLSADINKAIRNSSATFTLYKPKHENFTKNWDYIMVSEDQKSVVKYEWNEKQKKHIKSTIMDEVNGTTFRIEYRKDKSPTKDNFIHFTIIANVNGKDRTVESEIEGLNSLQIVDQRNSKNPSNTIAYRLEDRPGEVSQSQAAVSMVLDNSGSMANDMKGKASNEKNSRIYKLRQESNRLVDNLAVNPDIYISLTPFAFTGNSSQAMVSAQANTGPSGSLTKTINNMKADGGTNTGDGMRRGYHQIVDFNDRADVTKSTKNFMIILVDGVTTYASVNRVDEVRTGGTEKKPIYSLEPSFVLGSNDITHRNWRDTVKYNVSLGNGTFYGNGSKIDTDGTNYVGLIGSMIQNYKSKFNEGIKTYVIGFSDVSDDKKSLRDIAKATSGDIKYYEAGDETALRNIFDIIHREIDDSLWHIGGPQ